MSTIPCSVLTFAAADLACLIDNARKQRACIQVFLFALLLSFFCCISFVYICFFLQLFSYLSACLSPPFFPPSPLSLVCEFSLTSVFHTSLPCPQFQCYVDILSSVHLLPLYKLIKFFTFPLPSLSFYLIYISPLSMPVCLNTTKTKPRTNHGQI